MASGTSSDERGGGGRGGGDPPTPPPPPPAHGPDMTLHAQGVFPGDVPITWLEENGLYICRYCFQLVSNTRLSSHTNKCVGGAAAAYTQKTHPHLLMIHLLKFHHLTNLNQVSLHLRRCAFLTSQHCASFHQDPGPPLPGHCHQLCDVSFRRILRRHGSNFSCSRNVFFRTSLRRQGRHA